LFLSEAVNLRYFTEDLLLHFLKKKSLIYKMISVKWQVWENIYFSKIEEIKSNSLIKIIKFKKLEMVLDEFYKKTRRK